MEELVIEHTTLWDLFLEPSISLHLPRFALLLISALIIEITCSRKKVCLMCSVPTVILLLVTGLCGIIGRYYVVTSSFLEGERVPIPVWYYPAVGLFISGLTLVFASGVRRLLHNRFILNIVIRSLLFGITVYFAAGTAATPTRVNHSLAEWEMQHSR